MFLILMCICFDNLLLLLVTHFIYKFIILNFKKKPWLIKCLLTFNKLFNKILDKKVIFLTLIIINAIPQMYFMCYVIQFCINFILYVAYKNTNWLLIIQQKILRKWHLKFNQLITLFNYVLKNILYMFNNSKYNKPFVRIKKNGYSL